MPGSLKLRHVPKYGQLLRLLLAHRGALSAEPATVPDSAELRADARALVDTLSGLGPTYVKLGQLLASRTDLLPAAYTDELRHLEDHGELIETAIVRTIIEEELGVRVSRAFTDFSERPLGAASLAQVHGAALRDGRRVAIKVQRPGVRARILEDMEVVAELSTAVDEHLGIAQRAGLAAMVEQFHRALLGELDYRQEAANLRALGEFLAPYDQLRVPAPVEDFTSARVLTMEFVEGRSVASLTPVALPEIACDAAAEQLFRAYLDQVLLHGVFHADPHAGNVLLASDGRLALIDAGMTGWVSPELRNALLRLLVALGEERSVDVADALERAGEPLEDFDREALRAGVAAMIAKARGTRVEDLQAGRQLGDLTRVAIESGLRPAAQLSMIGKSLLNLDEVARRLAPRGDPSAVIRTHTAALLERNMKGSLSPGHLVTAALDAKEFAEQLPRRMNQALDTFADGSFRLRIEGVDEAAMMRSIQKLANRCAAGLAIGAFVLAAAIFSVAHSGPRWLGVNAFTVVFLALAFVLAGTLVLATLRSDLPQRRMRRSDLPQRRMRR